MAPALQHRPATQRPRVSAARTGGDYAGTASAAPPPEPDRVSTARRHAPLKFCADHSMGAGQKIQSSLSIEAARPVPPRRNGKPWKAKTSGAGERNKTLRAIRRLWKQWSSYHRRSLAETVMSRLKRFGERLSARDSAYQVTGCRSVALSSTLPTASDAPPPRPSTAGGCSPHGFSSGFQGGRVASHIEL
jgi:hypothetical protein